jgi:hypothetical protein
MLNRFAKTVSIAALTASVAFLIKSPQKASAQVLITGLGASSISTELIINWFDPVSFAGYAITGSGTGSAKFNSAQGRDSLRILTNNPVEIVPGVPAPISFPSFPYDFAISTAIPFGADLDDNGVVERGTADSTTALDTLNNTTGEIFRNATTIPGDNIPDVGIVNVNPIDSDVVLPVNVDFNGDGTQDFSVQLSQNQLCGVLEGTIDLWNDGNPGTTANDLNIAAAPVNAPIRRVYRGDRSGETVILNRFVENVLCGFPIANANGDILVGDGIDNDQGSADIDANDISALESQSIIDAVASTAGSIGYVNFSIAILEGFTGGDDFAILLPTGNDLSGDGVIGFNDLNNDGDAIDRVDLNNDGVIQPNEIEFDGQGENIEGFSFGFGSIYAGFYQRYPRASAQDAAGNLCLYITRGLDFDGNGIIENIGSFTESGRFFAINDIGYLFPTFPDLDPNCGTLFPGFGGLDANGDGDFTDAGDLLPGGSEDIVTPAIPVPATLTPVDNNP